MKERRGENSLQHVSGRQIDPKPDEAAVSATWCVYTDIDGEYLLLESV